jgi:uncharacterized protein YjbI with pentapeptide repeats
MDWEIYDLLGYGPLTEEIVEYLMGLLTTPASAGEENQFRPVELFQRLEDFYLRWCEGEFIDMLPETLPQKKMRLLRDQLKTQDLGQRQIDVYAGLNVMILLLELHRYGQETPEFKDKMVFYPCGEPNVEGKLDDASRLLRLIGYSCCVGDSGFFLTVGRFLSRANLRGADLSSANLSGAYLDRAKLSGANLTLTNLSDAYLGDANLGGANLGGANLGGAYLSGANLSGANLCNAYLSGADLRSANLSGADLSSANLSAANLSYADLSGANLSSANLSSADLWGANLSGADLSGADLSGADLSDVNLMGANLIGANLIGADLSGADLGGADLGGADLTDRTFGDVKWDENTKWENVRGLDTAVDVPEALRRMLGVQ